MKRQAAALLVLTFLLVLPGCGRGKPSSALAPSEELDRADNQWSRNDLELARKTLNGILEKKPAFFPALYRRGILAMWEDPTAAIADLEAARALAPDHPGPPFFLGMTRLFQREFEAGRREIQASRALANARLGIALRDTSEIARQGLAAWDAGRYGEARIAFTRIAETDSTDPAAWYFLGAASFRFGNPVLALQSAERALARRGDLTEAKVLRGLALLKLGRGKEARAVLDAVRAHPPVPASAHHLAGLLELESSDFRDAALAQWAAVLEDPTVSEYHTALGEVLLRMSLGDLGTRYLQLAETLRGVRSGALGGMR